MSLLGDIFNVGLRCSAPDFGVVGCGKVTLVYQGPDAQSGLCKICVTGNLVERRALES